MQRSSEAHGTVAMFLELDSVYIIDAHELRFVCVQKNYCLDTVELIRGRVPNMIDSLQAEALSTS
jgi:hypothetical protein